MDEHVLARTGAPPEATLRLSGVPADGADRVVDVHLPEGWSLRREWPVVVLLHGGFWRAAYDRRHTRPLAAALAVAGHVVVTPEYRRVGGGGGWPITFDDVAAAVGGAPGLLERLGLAPSTTTLLGHSAGGQLALWLAGRPGGTSYRVVALAPVADLRRAARERLGAGAVQAVLGGEPDEVSARYDAVDPVAVLADAPGQVVLVHGTADGDVPVGQSRSLAAAAPGVRLVELDGLDHYAPIDPLSAAWPVVLAAVEGR